MWCSLGIESRYIQPPTCHSPHLRALRPTFPHPPLLPHDRHLSQRSQVPPHRTPIHWHIWLKICGSPKTSTCWPTPQTRATSRILSVHVTHVVRGPLQV